MSVHRPTRWMRIDEAVVKAPSRPGLYQIKMGREFLKVGISANLRKRLHQHAKSSQARLKSPLPEPWTDPNQVASKGSILAKHLYFDRQVTQVYDLCCEEHRVAFLREQCWVCFRPTRSREAARLLERELETTGKYRYVGRVVRRDVMVRGRP